MLHIVIGGPRGWTCVKISVRVRAFDPIRSDPIRSTEPFIDPSIIYTDPLIVEAANELVTHPPDHVPYL